MSIETFPWDVDESGAVTITDSLRGGMRTMRFGSLEGRLGYQTLVRLFAENYPDTRLIQDELPFLTPDEREFLMTGMTRDEWDKAFPEEDNDA